ncbi:MAG: ATP-dependent DNA helicase [Gemmatimonadetes bacterium]|nr:ATP-dependent DNA helicase [Gemmatimonadota bacterium]
MRGRDRERQLLSVLRDRFGLDAFRPGQEEVIGAVLEGRDVLAVMPTGSGKSLLYQLPSVMLDGLTVVVSPLIALMKDQTDKLEELGVDVRAIHSGLTAGRQDEEADALQRGLGDLLYVTPERFRDREFFDSLLDREVALLVVDEAHCVSQWGHDFRPDYLMLGDVAERLGRPPVLALTATAPPSVRDDIQRQLRLRDPEVRIMDPRRPNLFFEVIQVPSEEKKDALFDDVLSGCEGTGIVYFATVKEAERQLERCAERWPLALYHGRRSRRQREEAQEAFMAGEVKAVFATNAFGLGIDKPDIRFVVHYHLPGSPEAYWQEAGRAGRDGEPALCSLLYLSGDERVQKYFLGGRYPSLEEVASLGGALNTLPAGTELALETIAGAADVSAGKARVLLRLLERREAVREHRGGGWSRQVDDVTEVDISRDLADFEERGAVDRKRIQAMVGYCRSARCRTRYLLAYLGEEPPDDAPCGHCDNDVLPDEMKVGVALKRDIA